MAPTVKIQEWDEMWEEIKQKTTPYLGLESFESVIAKWWGNCCRGR